MARGLGKASVRQNSNKKKNETGYLHRISRKSKKDSVNSEDVYEYTPGRTRRAKISMELDRSEVADGRYAQYDDKPLDARAQLIGENIDDEMIDSDDDEEIDSDAAFEESDEEKFAGFFSSKPLKRQQQSNVRFADVNLDENEVQSEGKIDSAEEDDDEDGQDGEFIDVLDVLDGRGEPYDNANVPETPTPKATFTGKDEDEVGDEEDDDEDLDMNDDFAPDEEEVLPEALDELENFVSNLSSTPQKRSLDGVDVASVDLRPRKRRMLNERTDSGLESEFRARNSDQKLSIEDLLLPLGSPLPELASLKKSAKALTSLSKTQTLTAPLPHRAQERLDRQAAYEQTKDEVDKWNSTMKRIQEAEHISFPLQVEPSSRVSNLELAAKFKPTTEMETAIDSLLKTAQLREQDITQTENKMLEANHLSVEEIEERRSELRKMRELMFRAEIKAKRVSKIKSKTYRKIKRKEKERLGELLAADESDGEDGRMKKDIERAKERATLRHKNTGKWAKQMRGKESWDGEGRAGIEAMLDRSERLRRKIAGKESEESDDGGDDTDENMDVDAIKARAFDEIQRISGHADLDATDKTKKSAVFEMKFMKDAMARQQDATNRMVDDFVKGMDDDAMANEAESSIGVVVQRQGGRAIYRPGTSDQSSVTLRTSPSEASLSIPEDPQHNPTPATHSKNPLSSFTKGEVNPWLTPRESESQGQSRKNNSIVVGKESKAVDKAKNKLKRANQKSSESQGHRRADAEVEVSLHNTLVTLPEQTTKIKGKQADESHHSDPDSSSEVDFQEQLLETKKGMRKGREVVAFQQRDLVALAFAGDKVVEDFQTVKKREIAADAPKTLDTTLPGWGSWGGTGTRKAPQKPHLVKQIAGVDPASRADYNKSHVIISEKRDKKAAKYLVKDLPYPYTSKAQFDRRMEQPLGPEWNTRIGFQRGTLPRVVKKMGTVINPVEKVF